MEQKGLGIRISIGSPMALLLEVGRHKEKEIFPGAVAVRKKREID